jgi:hypothetical protein
LSNPIELPSLEQIEEMDKERLQAIEALEISNDSIKCQKCGNSVPLLRTLTKPRSNRIDALQKRVKWIENHGHSNNSNKMTSSFLVCPLSAVKFCWDC